MNCMHIDYLLETRPVIEKSKMINVCDRRGIFLSFYSLVFIKEGGKIKKKGLKLYSLKLPGVK